MAKLRFAPAFVSIAFGSLLASGCSGGGGGGSAAPVARAGRDRAALVGSAVTLDGAASGDPDGDAVTYLWTFAAPAGSAATLSSTTIAAPTFTADAAGEYVATLVVADGHGDSAPDAVTVTAVPPRSIPDSGQTTSYTATPGEDADHATHPLSYTDGGETITDEVTGLVWQKCSLGSSGTGCATGALASFNWYQAAGVADATYNPGAAIDPCGASTLAGHSDWRLPTVRELSELAHFGRYDLAIDPDAFPSTASSRYWSATRYPATYEETQAWVVYYDHGRVRAEPKERDGHIRCVRGDPSAAVLEDRGDGTVEDLASGLTWQRLDGAQALVNWEQALSYCEGLSLGGHSDWRVPELKELLSIVDRSRTIPALDETLLGFPDFWDTMEFWSSTTDASATAQAWLGDFARGSTDVVSKTGTRWVVVRCVR